MDGFFVGGGDSVLRILPSTTVAPLVEPSLCFGPSRRPRLDITRKFFACPCAELSEVMEVPHESLMLVLLAFADDAVLRGSRPTRRPIETAQDFPVATDQVTDQRFELPQL